MCPYRLHPHSLDLQRNALRVEVIPPAVRCQLKPLKDRFGRTYDVLRWVYSGGDPLTCAAPCSGNCPLKVPGEAGAYGASWTAPCPICRTVNRLSTPGAVSCRECKQQYEITGGKP